MPDPSAHVLFWACVRKVTIVRLTGPGPGSIGLTRERRTGLRAARAGRTYFNPHRETARPGSRRRSAVSVQLRRGLLPAVATGSNPTVPPRRGTRGEGRANRSEEHTSELQSLRHLV